MKNAEIRDEALARARNPFGPTTNWGAIIDGFAERGIPVDEIRPRENVFTYQAWKALGRHVRKGEHGVKVITWVPMEQTKREREAEEQAKADGKPAKHRSHCRPWTATVFHISQTEPDGGEK